jgi:hypothetical protein
MMKIKYRFFEGQHCETNATGNLLSQQGIDLSEPMLFGLGEGLSFIFLNLSHLNLPFIGGRTKPFEITKTFCKNLGFQLFQKETSSKANALSSLQDLLSNKQCVGLQLDSYYLDYFKTKVHFAGHFVSVYGFDDNYFHVVDTKQQGSRLKCSYKSLEQARFAKGAMASKARYWTIDAKTKKTNLEKIIPKSIKNNAKEYLNPPFKGASFYGIEKLAVSLPKWISLAENPKEDLALAALLMERAGTGGSVFRNFYRDFLGESCEILKNAQIKKGYDAFSTIADHWSEVASLIEESSKTLDEKYLIQSSALCRSLAQQEIDAMKMLVSL